jgi:hypothetical protein
MKQKYIGMVLFFCLIGGSAFADIVSRINKQGLTLDDDVKQFIILTDGKVGIGTLTPSVGLEVNGNALFQGPLLASPNILSSTAADFTRSHVQILTVAAATTQNISFVNPPAPMTMILLLYRNIGVTLPSSIKWKNGITPVFSKPSSGYQHDIIGLLFDGSSYYGEANLDFK